MLQDAAINNVSDIVDDSDLIFDDSLGGTYAGDISGSGDLTKIGAATTTLNGDNTYTGATFINDGVLAVGGTGIGDASAVTVNSPATLTLNADETIGSLAGDGDVNGGFALTTGGNGGTTTFSGDISIDTINKEGAGTFNLTGTGTETTGINVDVGTVTIGGDFTSPQNMSRAAQRSTYCLAGDLPATSRPWPDRRRTSTALVTGEFINAGTAVGHRNCHGRRHQQRHLCARQQPRHLQRRRLVSLRPPPGTLAAELGPATRRLPARTTTRSW